MPPNKGMKQTKPSILELRSLSPVFDGPAGGSTRRTRPGRRDAGALPLLGQAPQALCLRVKSQLPETQQLIGGNRQLMRSPDTSGHQGAFSGVAEADVASLFSEAMAAPLSGSGSRGCVHLLRPPRSPARRLRVAQGRAWASPRSRRSWVRPGWAWRYHSPGSEWAMNVA